MERKKFNRGTVTGGIIRIVISIIALIIASTILKSTIKNWDSEEIGGGIFMCFIASVILITSLVFIINGIKMINNGRKSLEVARKGHEDNGKIIDLYETEVTETNNGCVSHYTIYTLKFEYTDDGRNLCESEEQISGKFYAKMQKKKLVPILVYKERAILDRKRFENENFSK